MNLFLRQLRPAALALIAFTVIAGVIYPMVMTATGQVAFNDQVNGSLIKRDGVVVGSSLVGQQFADPRYLHPRPSAAGNGYDPTASSGSNLGPTSDDLAAAVTERVERYRAENTLSDDDQVPVDAVTASASGLDPHISVANARLQAPRVAAQRNVPVAAVLAIIDQATDGRSMGTLGDVGVNVLKANLALDGLAG
jgi:potassium-transporting ATPase KdpC subunit